MTLLQPLFLLLAALCGLALITAYYLQRYQAPRVHFSAMHFLPSSSSSRLIRSALPPLLVLLPILTLTVITLPLSRPAVSQNQPVPVGLIVDDTAFVTVQDSPLRRIALTVADKLSSETHWGLFTTSGIVVAGGTGRESLITLVKSYSTGKTLPSYSLAIFQQAASFLKERSGAVPVLLLIGNNETFLGYPGLDSLKSRLDKDGIRLLSLSSASSDRPAFIAAVDLPYISPLNSEARARVGIANTTRESINGELRLLNKGNVLVSSPVKLAAQSLSWQELKVTPRDSGMNRYDIVLSADSQGIVEDKAQWELTAFSAQSAIIIASLSGSGPAFVEKALKASPLVGEVTVIDPQALDVPKLRQYLSKSKVVVMDGVNANQFDAELGTELKAWVELGGTLVFASGPNVNDRWNRHILGSILPAALKIRNNKPLQGVVTREHAVIRGLEIESVPLTVNQYLGLQSPPAQEVLISVGGEPLLLFKNVKLGTVFLWTSTLDVRWNNWAQQPSFPVFWSNILVYAVSGNTPVLSAHRDVTRTLWRTSSNTSNEGIYYIDYKKSPVNLPAPLQQALSQSVTAYRDYHTPVLAFGLALGAGYLGWMMYGWRRVRK